MGLGEQRCEQHISQPKICTISKNGVAGLFYSSLLPARPANDMEVGGFVAGLGEQRSTTVITHGISKNFYIQIPTRKKQTLTHRRLFY